MSHACSTNLCRPKSTHARDAPHRGAMLTVATCAAFVAGWRCEQSGRLLSYASASQARVASLHSPRATPLGFLCVRCS